MTGAESRMPAKSGRLKGWLVNIALVVTIFAAVQWWNARPLASGPAPPLAGVALDGQALDIAEMGGAPVMVHFWASWCPACKAMDGSVESIARKHRVVTVAMQSGDPGEIRQFLAREGLDFTVIPDPYGRIAGAWGVAGVPATFVIDGGGNISSSTIGFSTEPGLRARLWAAAGSD